LFDFDKIKMNKPPKKFKNQYMMYCFLERRNVRHELRTYNPKIVTRELASRWRRMSLEEKGRYVAMSEADKARWRREQQEFRQGREGRNP